MNRLPLLLLLIPLVGEVDLGSLVIGVAPLPVAGGGLIADLLTVSYVAMMVTMQVLVPISEIMLNNLHIRLQILFMPSMQIAT